MGKFLVIFLFGFLFLGELSAQERVLVAAAANISSVEAPLKAAFAKKYPAYTVEFTFGASGGLLTQILNGAPYEVFLSADKSFPQKIVDSGKAQGGIQVYALGKLIFLATKSTDMKKGLEFLLSPEVKQFANCNPETAPYGKAGMEALKKAELWDKLQSKLVVAQTITQAFQYAVTTTGFGFVNKSVLFTKEGEKYNLEGKNYFEVDAKLYNPIEQAFVVLKTAGAKPGPKAFADFLSSSEAKAVFRAAGYGLP